MNFDILKLKSSASPNSIAQFHVTIPFPNFPIFQFPNFPVSQFPNFPVSHFPNSNFPIFQFQFSNSNFPIPFSSPYPVPPLN